MDDAYTSRADRKLSAQDFAALGLNQLAYVKPIQVDGHDAFAVHAADGSQLAVFENRDTAVVAALRNDIQALSLH